MSSWSRPLVVRLRSGHVVRLRQVRPGDAAALAAAYANLGEQSRYRRFFTLLPELPESVLEAATDVDHVDHEALVALPLLADEIVGECRFVRLADRADTADLAVTIVDEWQGRGLGTELLARLSERALEEGIKNFTAEVLAENRAMLGMLDDLGRVEAELAGPVVSARIKIAEADRPVPQELLDLLAAVTRGEVVTIPAPLRRLIEVTDAIAKIVLLPVAAVLRAARH